MLDEAQFSGLKLKNTQGRWHEIESVPSMTAVWRLFELFPWTRLKYDPESNSEATQYWCVLEIKSISKIISAVCSYFRFRPPPLSSPRRVMKGQRIHDSAFVGSYRPQAHLPVELKWDMEHIKDNDLLEKGKHISFAQTLASDLKNTEKFDENLQSVLALVSNGKLSRRNVTFSLIQTLSILEQI